ncbi:lipopolysaccharide kinase InaA family protein [Desulfogranum marinum]|uniref:lipopolysaccharide kinase InaA family protein n=1 Tax=Desulfogranum marinum TaxID=453220 RepID=UPI00196535DC|nr:lipopolysaccharide kinase InaA family protein [Desulfogranum marinum]MBM9513007.1 hypothetical protein [Desulfogranum marinum]
MIIKDHLWISDKYREIFNCASLNQFEILYSEKLGQLIRQESEKSIRYFEVHHNGSTSGYYIKKENATFVSHLKSLLRKLSFLKLNTQHEFDLIQLYKKKGFAVVEPVALGERRAFGIPIYGFLIQKEVVGHEFIDLMKEGSQEERIKLLKAYGKLVGELHSKGLITSIVRVTDLICVSSIDGSWEDIQLMVIDREKGPLTIEQFSSAKGASILASILIRFFIYVDAPSAKEVRSFLRVYLKFLNVKEEIFFREMFLDVKRQFKVLYRVYKNDIDPVHKESICA